MTGLQTFIPHVVGNAATIQQSVEKRLRGEAQ
jgi:hypothetical protein